MARLNYQITIFNVQVGDTQGRLGFSVYSNYVGTPQFRIYPEAGPVPGWTNMDLSGTTYHAYGGTAPKDKDPGAYFVEYKDGNGERLVGKVEIFDDTSSCLYTQADYEENLNTVTITVTDSKVSITQSIQYFNPSGLIIDRVMQASIDAGVSWKTMTVLGGGTSLAEWSNSEMVSLGVDDNIDQILLKRVVTSCTTNPAEQIMIDTPVYEEMVVTPTIGNVTSSGGDDGSITLSITGGSGNRTYLWSTGATTQNISGLESGTYDVTVTDVITSEVVVLEDLQVLEPQPPSVTGTFLDVPFMNSISFVVSPIIPDDSEYYQQLDNVLFCKQYFPNTDPANYFQKVNKSDVFPTQFNTDFAISVVSLHDARTDALVKVFPVELKEQNIGVTEDFQINIRNHTVVGQSRIYFAAGAIPIPLNVGDVFEIINSPDGYNGNYAIVDIMNDATSGVQYLVINKNFTGPGLSPLATGRFTSNNAAFNVYEASHSFNDVADGQYYIKIVVSNDDTSITAISEPIDLQVRHQKTKLLEARCVDNSFGLTFTTGYIIRMRVPATFGRNRQPGGELATSRNSDFSLTTLSGKATRGLLFETIMIPPYLHEKISVLFRMDFKYINKLQVQCSEGYADPKYEDGSRLGSSSIKVEQATWFDKYNSDDIGTVNEGGFLITETGFLKR